MKFNAWAVMGGIAALAVLGGTTVATYTGSRGIRNNNPGNLVYNPKIKWKGQTGTDGRFAVFSNPHDGIRAMTIDITGDIFKDGLGTLSKLIEVYAPRFENKTGNYISFVSKRVGLAPDASITRTHIPAIVAAMIQMENGTNPYPPALLNAAVAEGVKYVLG